uniref:Uncharacterized protein n=1 Tax=Acrobeloides nanus TaxID=290746 RepID=A0A914DTV8_9BILA
MPSELQDLEAEMLCDQTEPPGQEPSILDPRISAQDLKDDKSLVETVKEKISDAYDAMKEKTSEITDKNPKVDQIHTGETVVDQIQHIAEGTADKVEDMTEASKDYLSAIGLFSFKSLYDSPKERRYNDTRESDDS